MIKYKLFSTTNFIIFLTILIFILQNTFSNIELIFGLNYYLIYYHFWWQPLSSMFIHGNLMHIIMNMAILYQFGNIIEQQINKKIFFILYIFGGIITSIFSFIYIYYFNNSANIIGASGAISVLIGFIALSNRYQRKGMIIWILLISFAPLLLGINIAWYSHLIGFGLGFLFGFLSIKIRDKI